MTDPGAVLDGSMSSPASVASARSESLPVFVDPSNQVTFKLRSVAPPQPGCTGTLVSPTLVLTAGHCIVDAKARPLSVLFRENGPKGVKVVKTVAVHQALAFPRFVSVVGTKQLAEPAPASAVPVRVLTDATELVANTSVDIAGYGEGSASKFAGQKALAKVVVDRYVDDPLFRAHLLFKSDGPGSCFGDSGGPLFLKWPDGWVLAGITEGVPLDFYEGDDRIRGKRGMYTFPGPYLDWIESSSHQKLLRAGNAVASQVPAQWRASRRPSLPLTALCKESDVSREEFLALERAAETFKKTSCSEAAIAADRHR